MRNDQVRLSILTTRMRSHLDNGAPARHPELPPDRKRFLAIVPADYIGLGSRLGDYIIDSPLPD
jgi:hypothetical protein